MSVRSRNIGYIRRITRVVDPLTVTAEDGGRHEVDFAGIEELAHAHLWCAWVTARFGTHFRPTARALLRWRIDFPALPSGSGPCVDGSVAPMVTRDAIEHEAFEAQVAELRFQGWLDLQQDGAPALLIPSDEPRSES